MCKDDVAWTMIVGMIGDGGMNRFRIFLLATLVAIGVSLCVLHLSLIVPYVYRRVNSAFFFFLILLTLLGFLALLSEDLVGPRIHKKSNREKRALLFFDVAPIVLLIGTWLLSFFWFNFYAAIMLAFLAAFRVGIIMVFYVAMGVVVAMLKH